MKLIKPNTISTQVDGSFTRDSIATYIDNGVMQVAAPDTPRFEDGKLLLEKEATNLAIRSQDLSFWSKVDTTVSASTLYFKGYAQFWTIAKANTNTSAQAGIGLGSVQTGTTLVSTLALLANTVNTCSVGLYDTSGWGNPFDSTAEILEGPGTITVWSGGLFVFNNLSSSVPTLVKITRKILATSTVSLLVYPGLTPQSTQSGASVRATRAQVERGIDTYIPLGSSPNLYRGQDLKAGPGVYGAASAIKSSGSNPGNFLPGETITISAKIYQDRVSAAESGQRARLYWSVAPASGPWFTSSFLDSFEVGQTGRLSMTVTLPDLEDNMVNMAVGVYHIGGPGSYPGTVFADDIMVERSSEPSSYEKGGPVRLQKTTVATNLINSSPTVAQLSNSSNVTDDIAQMSEFENSIYFPGNGTTSWAYQSFSLLAGTLYTLSAYIKIEGGPLVFNGAGSDSDGTLTFAQDAVSSRLTVEQVDADIYRVSHSAVGPGSGSNFGVVKYSSNTSRPFWVMGYQLEVGLLTEGTKDIFVFPYKHTSYIPTTTVAATRTPDRVLGHFSRSTVATYINSSGGISSAAINEPRYQDGVLLIEPASRNLVEYSEDLSQWTSNGQTLGSMITAPDGLATARQITNGTMFTPITSFPGEMVTVSQYVKLNAASGTLRLYCDGAGASPSTYADWSLPSQSLAFATAQVINPQLTVLANGWYRLQFSFVPTSPNYVVHAYPSGAGIFTAFWGTQVEYGDTATSYIPTQGFPVNRAADTEAPALCFSSAIVAFPDWSAGVSEPLGQRVSYQNRVYESLISGNLGNIPSASPSAWLDLGVDNKHAVIDGIVNTPTTGVGSVQMILKYEAFDSFALIDLDAVISNISVYDGDTFELLYYEKIGLASSEVSDWFEFFFTSLTEQRTQVVRTGLTSTPNAIIALDLRSASTENASIGQLTVGEMKEIGTSQYNAKAGIIDYSKKDTDEFGKITFVERPYSKRLEADIHFPNSELNRVHRTLTSIRATPVVWILTEDLNFEEPGIIYGFYKDFSTVIAYPSHSLCNLQIEGLT